MRTEISPKAMEKARLDRIAHYNVHMVLIIRDEDKGFYVYEARKAYRKCRNKKSQRKIFWIDLWKKEDIIENKLSEYCKKGRSQKRFYVEAHLVPEYVIFEMDIRLAMC